MLRFETRRGHDARRSETTGNGDSNATIKERYVYDAYGTLSIFDSGGTARSSTTEGNRYTEALEIYHYRARMYDAAAGRFLIRDPSGYQGSPWSLMEFVQASPTTFNDPMGLDKIRPPKNMLDNNGCCAVRGVRLICRTMPAAQHVKMLTHCYLAFVDDDGKSIDVLSGQQGNDGQVGLSDTEWDQDYFEGFSSATQWEHGVVAPPGSLCKLYGCLYKKAASLHGQGEYTQGYNDSNTFLSTIMRQCGMAASFPASAVAAEDISDLCMKKCLGPGRNVINAPAYQVASCKKRCKKLQEPGVLYTPPDPYEGLPDTWDGRP